MKAQMDKVAEGSTPRNGGLIFDQLFSMRDGETKMIGAVTVEKKRNTWWMRIGDGGLIYSKSPFNAVVRLKALASRLKALASYCEGRRKARP